MQVKFLEQYKLKEVVLTERRRLFGGHRKALYRYFLGSWVDAYSVWVPMYENWNAVKATAPSRQHGVQEGEMVLVSRHALLPNNY